MRSIYLIMIVCLLACAGASQSPSKTLRQAEKALGGEKALKSVRSLLKTGRVKRLSDGTEGRYVLQTTQPNFYNETIETGGFEIEYGFNGRSAWSRNSRDGLQTYTGSASTDFQALAAYRNWLWLNASKEKARLTAGSGANLDGKAANSVILSTPKGSTIKMFFDAATGLPLRDEARVGEAVNACSYSDYREIGGLKQPFAFRCEIQGEAYDIALDEVKVNPQIARSEFDFPNLSGEPLPDIRALLKQLEANEERVEDLLETYSFTQKQITRELAKDGSLRETQSETRQLSFYKGRRITRTIEKNGKPLTPGEQEKEDKEVAKQVAEIEKQLAKEDVEAAKRIAKGEPAKKEENNGRVSVAELLKASNLLNPRRERFRGREVIVFDFEPNPSFDMKNAKSALKFFGKTAGVMWVDEKDKQVARVQAVLADSIKIAGGLLAKLNKGAAFSLDRERIGDEIWLPSQTELNLAIRLFLVKGIDVNQVTKSYNYRKFATEVKGAEINEVKKPE